ncbi:hypothetical protein A3C89_03980 [Candidatus Kaiserbacteria bacterium RIFCSPHIGHO2_02_FULL_50_50]|uniref:DUF5671 domain-containing protein n=1 Tax=Candidatus Kaiserbacteria bacterium RIFCSPHIGHO2_02_FULL_50_50 TaxID=1798492 RepID=A0A1F6DF35_9BACT|nr:MAG: hypothetical protein A3C89_03980 [Candidatus Kaiserbacteria bacterium RIFCSPHIGHO2_02_FULL_50_50]OGG88469.1 MAG: hypothetical protein A3G62_01945 [Candidatus Kaiserbacteria bacterium RIFCSPLOWO2_12_FULL_50_10]
MSLLVFMFPTLFVAIFVGVVLVIAGAVSEKMGKKFTATEAVVAVIHFLSLAAVALSLTQIGFTAAEKWIPDLLVDNAWRKQSMIESTRYALSVLIVTAPLYVIILRKSQKTMDAWIQKFMAGAVLLTSGIVALSTLAVLVYNFISGEIGLRFGIQLAVVLLVSGGIAAYYQLHFREKVGKLALLKKFYLLKVVALVIIAVIVGFMVTGGPAGARAERFDDRRLSDLSSMQWQIQSYYEQNKIMPKRLLDLHDAVSGYALPADPRTKAAYEYRVIKEGAEIVNGTERAVAEFELCATFETERTIDSGADAYQKDSTAAYLGGESFLPSYYQGDMSSHWNHGEGKECFTRILKRYEQDVPGTPVPYQTMQAEPAFLE